MVVCTVTKEGDINNHGYASYWEWQEEFERRLNNRHQEAEPIVQTFKWREPRQPKEHKPKERKYEARWKMYEAGMTDKAIAEAEGKTPSTIHLWRAGNGLPVNRRTL
jgi:hypothetical protein